MHIFYLIYSLKMCDEKIHNNEPKMVQVFILYVAETGA